MKKIILTIFGLLLIFPFTTFAFYDSVGHSNEKAIDYLQQKNVVQGYGDGTYRPDSQINRAEFLKIILESLNVELNNEGFCFADLHSDWYVPYICKAKDLGIVSGYADGYFRPGNKINLVEGLKIILEAYNASLNYSYPVWYEPYFYFMQNNGLLSLVNINISHQLTRGEMAQILYNLDDYYGRIESKSEPIRASESLTQYPLSTVDFAGKTWNANLNIGDTYKLSENDFLRLDKIENGTAQMTLWNNDNKGCRLVDGAIYLKVQVDNKQYKFYKNWLIELETLSADSIDLKIYTGDLAYRICMDSSLQTHRCLTFHEVGLYKVQSENFVRYFESQSSFDYNNLMLNYLEAAYAKLKLVFPSLISAHPYGNHWNFISPQVSKALVNSAWLDTAVVEVAADGDVDHKLLMDSDLRNTYAKKIIDGDLNFTFSTEIHEWTHLFLYPTELLRNPNPIGTTSKLGEGIADYIQSVAKHYPDGLDKKHTFCGEDRFIGDGNFLSGMSYVDAFNQGYHYDAGNCFFKQVEQACGFASIDSMFKELYTYQYEPFSYHSNLFKVLKNNCSHQSAFDEIMANFGFSAELLNETYQQGRHVPIKEMACH